MRDNIMRAKRFEKLLERRQKKVTKAQQKIENLDIEDTKYMNQDGKIDWDKLAKHVKQALKQVK